MFRIQDNYNKIYEKINIALAFSGVILTIIIELTCLGGSLIVIVGATIYLLLLLRGRKIAVFKSEDFRNEERYRNKESHAALLLE